MSFQVEHFHGERRSVTKVASPLHIMKVYSGTRSLIESAGEFLVDGVKNNQGAVIVTNAEHLERLIERLMDCNIDVAELVDRGQILLLDTAKVLSLISDQGRIDELKFNKVIGEVLTKMNENFGHLRVFGEIVNDLCSSGQFDAANTIETLMSQLAEKTPLSLMCGYEFASFASAPDPKALKTLCEHHNHIWLDEGDGLSQGPELN